MNKKWFMFYITLLIALLANGFFGIYKEKYIYAEAINMFGISILCFASAFEHYLRKKNK